MATRPQLVKQDASRDVMKLTDEQQEFLDKFWSEDNARKIFYISATTKDPNFADFTDKWGKTPTRLVLQTIVQWKQILDNLLRHGGVFDKFTYRGYHHNDMAVEYDQAISRIRPAYPSPSPTPVAPPSTGLLSKLTTSPAAEKAKAAATGLKTAATGLFSGMFKPKAGGRRRKTRRVSRK